MTGHIIRLVSPNNVEVDGVPRHVLDIRPFSCYIRRELSKRCDCSRSGLRRAEDERDGDVEDERDVGSEGFTARMEDFVTF